MERQDRGSRPGELVQRPEELLDRALRQDNDGVSVAEEDRDPKSLLNHYRRLLALRRSNPAIVDGCQRVLVSPADLLVVERTGAGERLVIVANLSGKAVTYPVTGRDLLAGRRVAGSLRLEPYQATVVRR